MLKRCLESLFDLEPSLAHKVIICDDLSEDQVRLRNLLGQFPVKLLIHKERVPYAKMINSGIIASRTNGAEGLITVNNDIEHKSPFLDKIEETCLKDPLISCIGALLFYPNGDTQHSGVEVTSDDGIWCEDHYRGKIGWSKERYVHHVTGAWQFIKYEELPCVYNDAFQFTFEDVDFNLRCWEKGRRALFTPDISHIHHESATRGKRVTQREIDSAKLFKDSKYDFTSIDVNIMLANKSRTLSSAG